jgi:carboxymethylenebutenolidase
METVRTAIELKESSGKVALLGFCLGALMVFITTVRYEVDAAVAYHGADTLRANNSETSTPREFRP